MRPLFESFDSSVSTLSFDALRRTVLAWLNEHCSLLSLRPGRAALSSSLIISFHEAPCRMRSGCFGRFLAADVGGHGHQEAGSGPRQDDVQREWFSWFASAKAFSHTKILHHYPSESRQLASLGSTGKWILPTDLA